MAFYIILIGKCLISLLLFLHGMLQLLENTNQQSYQGHYVVLVGFNSESREILYRNPSVKDKVCYMSYDCLEESRSSYGTDEDVFIYLSSIAFIPELFLNI